MSHPCTMHKEDTILSRPSLSAIPLVLTWITLLTTPAATAGDDFTIRLKLHAVGVIILLAELLGKGLIGLQRPRGCDNRCAGLSQPLRDAAAEQRSGPSGYQRGAPLE